VRTIHLVAGLCVVVSTYTLFADQVVLKNGDRLSGTITKSDEKVLLLKTDFAGDVSIDWPAVQEITAAEPLHISLKDGQTLVGPVTTSDGNLSVSAKGGTVSAPKDAVVSLRNEAEETTYEQTQHPRFTQGWAGGLNVGFALTRGNSQTKNLSLAFTADRKTLHDHLGLYANTVYASDDAPGVVPSTTANATQGGIRYDHDLTARVFGFVNADFQHDALQSLDLRSVLGGGLGFHSIKNDQTTLDFLAGLNYTRESYSSFNRNFAALTLGEEFMHKLGASTVLSQKLYFYPDLNDAGQYHATGAFATVTKLSKWLGWQNGFNDIYVTNPPVGKKQNDIQLTTGLTVAFSH
jgi:putative salt-induced outer membrane protein YdiY